MMGIDLATIYEDLDNLPIETLDALGEQELFKDMDPLQSEAMDKMDEKELAKAYQAMDAQVMWGSMDAQEKHDYRMSRLIKAGWLLTPGSRARLEDSLKAKSAGSRGRSQQEQLGPIESAMRNNPGLTRERAEEIAEAFGF